MDTFSMNTPIKMEEGKWIIGVTSVEVYNSVFDYTRQNKSFAIYTPGFWVYPETSEKLHELIEQRKVQEMKSNYS